jgi:uncharacterized membrane protein YtjA (UPF0391 family)
MLEPTLLLIMLIVLASLLGYSSMAVGLAAVVKLMFVAFLLMFVASIVVTGALLTKERGGWRRRESPT